MRVTVGGFFQEFPTSDACLDHLLACRYRRRRRCPKCRNAGRFHRVKGHPCYSCQWCGHHVHPCVGTPFEHSRTPLQTWFYAIYLFSTSSTGVTASELQRRLGVTYKTAWRMHRKIAPFMVEAGDGIGSPDGADVEAGVRLSRSSGSRIRKAQEEREHSEVDAFPDASPE